MKIGLFWDSAININSYYIKNGKAFRYLDHQPYFYHHAFSPECFGAVHNLPFLWNDGVFLNLSEWQEKNLPDEEFDLIFYSNERIGLTNDLKQKYSIDKLRDKYKTAKITGHLKEVNVKEDRFENRIEFLKTCDGLSAEAFSFMKTLPEFTKIKNLVGKELKFIHQPINIDYVFKNFYSNIKNKSIFAYTPNPIHRRGDTLNFATYLGKKYNLEVFKKDIHPNQKFDYISQFDFVKMWSKHLFHINLDPTFIHPGQQCLQVAAVGSINIGGNNESHSVLYPSLNGTDLNYLEEIFVELLNNPKKQIDTISYALETLRENYSFKTIKKQVEKIYESM